MVYNYGVVITSMMSDRTRTNDRIALGEPALKEGVPITIRVVLSAMAGGFVGMVLMLPVLVGIPALFGLFRTDPIAEFAPFLVHVGFEPSLALGVALFVIGGTTVLPVMFTVVGEFLPPMEPRALKGVTFATIFWVGFVLAFWPGGGALTIALFLVVSLLAHWIYGLTLGVVLDRTTGVPEHAV